MKKEAAENRTKVKRAKFISGLEEYFNELERKSVCLTVLKQVLPQATDGLLTEAYEYLSKSANPKLTADQVLELLVDSGIIVSVEKKPTPELSQDNTEQITN
jgi:hypothetical protein